jgi:protein TonB
MPDMMTNMNAIPEFDPINSAERNSAPSRAGHHAWRFAACLGLALIVHAGAVFALLAPWQEQADGIDGAPILVELATVTAAPHAQQQDLAPGPLASETQPTAPQPKQTEDAAAKPLPSLLVAPVADAQAPAPVETAAANPAPVHLETAEAPAPPREKTPSRRQAVASLDSTHARAPSAAMQHATRASAPSSGAGLRDDDALPNWKSQLLAQLERNKRYPAEARGGHGITLLAFSVDRQGGVHRARVARSSGSALLDQETLALLQRAQPLPSPPPQMRGAQIAVTVPIRYTVH